MCIIAARTTDLNVIFKHFEYNLIQCITKKKFMQRCTSIIIILYKNIKLIN